MSSPACPRRARRSLRVVLRRRGLAAVRGDHPAARILSDPDRDRDPARARAAIARPHRPAARAVVEFGSGVVGQDAAPAPDCIAPAAYVPIDITRRFPARRGRRRSPASSPGLPISRSRPISPSRSACRRGSARLPRARLLPRLDDRQHGRRDRRRPAARDARDARRGIAHAADRHRPGQGRAVLVAAYDDAAGVTAAFNLNLLHRHQPRARRRHPVDAFRHLARLERRLGRIEMHLEAQADVAFTSPATHSRWRRARPSTPRTATNSTAAAVHAAAGRRVDAGRALARQRGPVSLILAEASQPRNAP